MTSTYIAHVRRSDGAEHLLQDHLLEVAELAGALAAKIGIGSLGELVGLLHDIGKATIAFQRYIKSRSGKLMPDDPEYTDWLRGELDHSTAGAQFVYRYGAAQRELDPLLIQMLAIVIASHHMGLIDCINPQGKNKFAERMRKEEPESRTDEAVANLDPEILRRVNTLLSGGQLEEELAGVCDTMIGEDDDQLTGRFKLGLLTRFLLSCLLDADVISTQNFEYSAFQHRKGSVRQPVQWALLGGAIERHVSTFSQDNELDRLRAVASRQCLEAGRGSKGIYQLTLPTGAGKTFASLRFALEHARQHSEQGSASPIERIVYIVPYTAIIDQNAESIREALRSQGVPDIDAIVLEHHSALAPERETEEQRKLASSWNAPIILTTMVRFLETLFSSGTGNARLTHQLANAVLIFDEIQALPIRSTYMFTTALQFLTETCGSTAVLCTATQPGLVALQPPFALSADRMQSIVTDGAELFRHLERVEAFDERKIEGWADDEIAELALAELAHAGSVLIVVNTKHSALSLWRSLEKSRSAGDMCLYHLSTRMCAAHRMDLIKRMKAQFESPRHPPIICVSTQLIEAGVDIDFGSVIRYIAGLDSIVQASGRCNRHGRRGQKGRVIVLNPRDENLDADQLIDIRKGRESTERVWRELEGSGESLLGTEALRRYFIYYYAKQEQQMSYPVGKESVIGRSDNLVELLSMNRVSETAALTGQEDISNLALKQAFHSAAKAYEALDSSGIGVIVPYEDGKRIIRELSQNQGNKDQMRLLREAQRYSVNVHTSELSRLIDQRALDDIGAGILAAKSSYYDKQTGLSATAVSSAAIRRREPAEIIVDFLVSEISASAIILFGSAARGELRADSDYDIAYLSSRKWSPYERFMAAQRLAGELGRDVDLIDFAEASTVFQAQIVGGGEVLYDADPLSTQSAFMVALKSYALLNDEREALIKQIDQE